MEDLLFLNQAFKRSPNGFSCLVCGILKRKHVSEIISKLTIMDTLLLLYSIIPPLA